MPKSMQQPLPPMTLQSVSRSDEVRKSLKQDEADLPDSADMLASRLFDEALSAAKITSKEVAILLQVSESLVSRWRKPEAREIPSYGQMHRLPPAFHRALNKAENRHFGFTRQALLQLLDAAGELSLAVSE